MTDKQHVLHAFMRQMNTEMASEYERIQLRATDDPGTAGDEGEENWAEVFRGWLPRNYEVVTKGRIINEEGLTSPQMDVLVLNVSYPTKLLNKKHYLAAGVAAAFECKTTLKSAHISQAFKRCRELKNLYKQRTGSPYRELHSPIVYGLLAHSHSWKGNNSNPDQTVSDKVVEADLSQIPHPRLQPDLICVADLGTWTCTKFAFIGPCQVPDWQAVASKYGPTGAAYSSYIALTCAYEQQLEHFAPIGGLISYLTQKLARENPTLRNLADYYRLTNIAGQGAGRGMRRWQSSIYSDGIRPRVEAGRLSNGVAWDEWSLTFV